MIGSMIIKRFSSLPKWLIFTVALLLGALVILALRFAMYQPEHVHYHANFAVYINGAREEFKGARYYQEVAVCSATNGIAIPEQRAHMHDNVNSVVHVHDHAVTWGQFFENLGWVVGPDFIETDSGAKYIASDSSKLHVLINGQDYTDLTPITNMVIKDQSRLLLSFGNIDVATLQAEDKTVPSTAAHDDSTNDPASCSGHDSVTVGDRLHHLLK
jgi:hypothetical protein